MNAVPMGFWVFVDGTPQTKGSAKAFMRPGARFPTVVNDNERNKSWEAQIKHMLFIQPLTFHRELAVSLDLEFRFHRPKGHYGSGKKAQSLKPNAVKRHVSRPDLDKLVRSVGDALKGIAYADDSQVFQIAARKVYCCRWFGQEGVLIKLAYHEEVGQLAQRQAELTA